MTGSVYETTEEFAPEAQAEIVSNLWSQWNSARQTWISEKKELRNYLFATDTTKTTNSMLHWKNSTTLPKLTQIRDNLHSNYIAAAFPNDNWLKWEGHSLDAEVAAKKDAITSYMRNKTREDNFMEVVSQLLLDYIDYGNAFCDVKFVQEYKKDPETGEDIPQYIGPRATRIHPFNIVFNPLAEDFYKSPKIVRHLKNIGELKKDAEDQPQNAGLQKAVAIAESMRSKAITGGSSKEETDMFEGLAMDGFGSYSEYLRSGMVEILEFEGDIFDTETGKLLRNRKVLVSDRMTVLLNEEIPDWLGSTKFHVGWRTRPDNAWAMGPLDNLVGMQYRIDHLENLKADMFDLIAAPPLLIRGEVEEFNWGPYEEIHVDEGGDVSLLNVNAQALNADMQIAMLEQRMEEYAGAPKQAMGIRTPGEKTAFEVQQLQNAAGRIFQVKINNFELNLLEPLLNAMLQVARRNMDLVDTIRVMDDDIGVVSFMNVTKEDITAAGKLRPIGSRHFSAQAQLMQNLLQLFNSSVGQLILPNVSTKELTKLVEEALQLEKFQLFSDNAQLFEQAERQQLSSQIQEELAVQQAQPPVI